MENNTSKINSIKKFFFDTVLKQGGQTVLKEAAKLLSKLKISLGNINISPIIQIKSNNGITIGQDWHISAGELLGRISEQERQELGKFSKLLMETFTKNGGGMKSTAYLELERNLMVKEAKKAISPATYHFILEKIPVTDRSTWLAALVIKHQMDSGAHALANAMQQQVLLLKAKTGMVITNLMMDGFLEKTLIANYNIFTNEGQQLSGERAFAKLYQQIIHDIPNATNAWGYGMNAQRQMPPQGPNLENPESKLKQHVATASSSQKITLDTVAQVENQVNQKSRLSGFKPISLQEQIEKAKFKIESLGQKLSGDKLPHFPKTKDLT